MTTQRDNTPSRGERDERLTRLLERLAQAIETNPERDEPSSTTSAPNGGRPVDHWLPPIPLSDRQTLPTFPIRALPEWLGQWVEAEAVETQTPPDMAAMLALATLATGGARRLRVRARHGWIEPTNLYVAIVLPPGNRKSAVFRHATLPLGHFERRKAMDHQPQIEESRAAIRLAEQQLQQAEHDAKHATPAEAAAMARAARRAAQRLRTLQEEAPVVPRLLSGDITQEALARLLKEQDECMAVMDSEGIGPIALMLGRYTNDSSRLDLFLRGHPGDSYLCDRLGRDPLRLHFPRITLAITCQPTVLRQLTSHREARGLGLLARILFVVPQSTLGERIARPPAMSSEVRAAYSRNVDSLLRLPAGDHHGTHLLTLSAAADQLLERYQLRIEQRLGEGRDLCHMADWASKLCGAAVRIAGLLHAAENLQAPWAHEVALPTMKRAVTIAEHLLSHARHVFDVMLSVPETDDAYRVLRWIHRKRLIAFSRRQAFNSLRRNFTSPQALAPALKLLQERGWIRTQPPTTASSRGRPPGPSYEVHPLLYADEDAEPEAGQVHATSNTQPDSHG